jgi:hypothetical protein
MDFTAVSNGSQEQMAAHNMPITLVVKPRRGANRNGGIRRAWLSSGSMGLISVFGAIEEAMLRRL